MSFCASCGAALNGATYCPNCGANNSSNTNHQTANRGNQPGTNSHSPLDHAVFGKGFRRDYMVTYLILVAGIVCALLSNFVFENGLGGRRDYIENANYTTYAALALLAFSFLMNYRIALAIGVGLSAIAGLIFLAYGFNFMTLADFLGVSVDLGLYASLCGMVISYIFAARKIGTHPVKFSQDELRSLHVPRFIARGQSSKGL